MPVAGSAYTFSYATLGELVAWIIGWDLLLELMLGASVVAQGWSQYAELFLEQIGIGLALAALGSGDSFDLLAFLLVAVLDHADRHRHQGVDAGQPGARRRQAVHRAVRHRRRPRLHQLRQLQPVHPAVEPRRSDGERPARTADPADLRLAADRLRRAAASSPAPRSSSSPTSASTSSRPPPRRRSNPQRDLPLGIIGSLVICTVLYVAVALVITGMVPYAQIDPKAALATAFTSVGKAGYATLISAGAVAGLTTVVMTLLIGATRVVFAMSRDWLLPRRLARTNPRTGTPVRITLIIGALVALVAVAHADRHAGGDGQHRHAGRVHPGLDRGADPAQAPARPAAVVQGAVHPGAADPRRGRSAST